MLTKYAQFVVNCRETRTNLKLWNALSESMLSCEKLNIYHPMHCDILHCTICCLFDPVSKEHIVHWEAGIHWNLG